MYRCLTLQQTNKTIILQHTTTTTTKIQAIYVHVTRCLTACESVAYDVSQKGNVSSLNRKKA